MSAYFKDDAHAHDFKFNLKEKNFRLAVSIEDYFAPRRLKDDPKYVKWIFRLYGKKKGVWY